MLEEEKITTLMEEDDTLLPDGWQEGVDIFTDEDWAGERLTDELAADLDREAEEHGDEDGAAPTTERDAPHGDGGSAVESEGAPTTESQRKQPHKLKFKARVDRQDLDVEVDESELPALYQKAQVTERMQSRLAKLAPAVERAEAMARSMGYDSLDAMMEKTREGMPAAAAEGSSRDLRGEVRALMTARPELKGKSIPDGVMKEFAGGKNLLTAYVEYEAGQHKAEAERLRKEIEVLKQNAAAAAKAPVGGTRGGGETDPFAGDDFLRGFHEEA